MSTGRDHSRACAPEEAGYVERDGVRVYWERYGDSAPTILFLPSWTIVHSRLWKAQLPYFGRHFRALTFDPRGNGMSDHPAEPAGYREEEFAADALAVMDASGTDRAFLVGSSLGAQRALLLAANHPECVQGVLFIGPTLPFSPNHPGTFAYPPDVPLPRYDGWEKFNFHHWQQDFRGFLEFFYAHAFTEPHSTKQLEDSVTWGLQTTPETLMKSVAVGWMDAEDEALELCARVRCPVLVVHGSEDGLMPPERGRRLAEATGGELVTIEGGGHAPQARDPVRFNLLLRDFVAPPATRGSSFVRAASRPRRALFVSSPIGLGHARRDVAIARELRALVPDLQIDWLAQDPVTRVLEAEGERIHPASRHLANESAHLECESGEHELDCFGAWRSMDEILVANFMVFHDVVASEPYDVWIADEGWEIDHYLHENPELKNAAYVWLTDFVGWLPMPAGGKREAFLTADYNAEMVEHIARYPRVRDRSIFVGDIDDIVGDRLGPDLPLIRDWTAEHFDFAGYITGSQTHEDRETLRAELGYQPHEKVCVVTVGGSGVGEHLLRRVAAAYPEARRLVPDLRMEFVAGPRIGPATIAAPPDVAVHPYVHDLHRHLAACDVAVVQGGLSTTMELTANGRPFIYVPLARHFEQRLHVAHRLERYRAGRRMEYAESPPEVIAQAICEAISSEPDYRPVDTDGARRAASLIAELL